MKVVHLPRWQRRSALAQVQQGLQQASQTDNVTLSFTANQSGSNSSQCVTPLQFGNTGSNQNAQGVLQYSGSGQSSGGKGHHHNNNGTSSGDIQQEGNTFTFSPSLTANCEQTVQQAASASSQYSS